jgi:hypothetical protein
MKRPSQKTELIFSTGTDDEKSDRDSRSEFSSSDEDTDDESDNAVVDDGDIDMDADLAEELAFLKGQTRPPPMKRKTAYPAEDSSLKPNLGLTNRKSKTSQGKKNLTPPQVLRSQQVSNASKPTRKK